MLRKVCMRSATIRRLQGSVQISPICHPLLYPYTSIIYREKRKNSEKIHGVRRSRASVFLLPNVISCRPRYLPYRPSFPFHQTSGW
jgi:hypothetical protein